MGRSEKQLDPQSGPLARLALDLRDLRRQAGAPTYRELSRIAGCSPSALSAATSGAALPSAAVLTSYVHACGGDVDAWLRRRAEVARTMSAPDPVPVTVSASGSVPDPATPPATRRHRFTRRAAGLLAAAIVGSMATVVPMAVWGAPSCLTDDHGRPVPAGHCQPLTAR